MSWMDIYDRHGGRSNKREKAEESKHVALGSGTTTSEGEDEISH